MFLAICYLIVGCAYVAGLGAGDSVACREPFQSHIKIGRMQMLSTITQVRDAVASNIRMLCCWNAIAASLHIFVNFSFAWSKSISQNFVNNLLAA